MAGAIKVEAAGAFGPLSAIVARLRDFSAGDPASGAALAFLVRVAGAGLGYGLHILLARFLGAGEFGSWAASWTILLIAGHAASLGFSESVVRFYTAHAARAEWSQGRGFLISGSLVTIVFASLLAALSCTLLLVFSDALPPGMVGPLSIAALALPLFAFQDWLEGVSRAFGRPVLALAPVYILRPVFIAAILTGLAFSGRSTDASSAMAAVLAAIALAVFIQGLFVYRAAPRELFGAKPQYNYSLWITGSASLAAAFLIDQLAAYADILALATTASASETGAYFAAARIIALASLAPYAVSVIAGRDFAFHHARGDAAGLKASVRRTARWTFWASIALLLGLLLAGPLLLSMFGRDFLIAAPCISLLALGLVARAAGGHSEDLLMALGHQRENVRIAIVAAFVALGLAFAATPYFGLLGAAGAMTCAAAIRSVLYVRAARRLTGLYAGIGRDTFTGDRPS